LPAFLKLKSLRALKLTFVSCKNINDQALKFLSEGLLNLKSSLLTFTLNLSSNYLITNKGIKSLSLSLKNFDSLSALHLDFCHCQEIDNFGLEDFSWDLKSISTLKNLSLIFGYCNQINDEGLTTLANGIQNLKALSKLDLNFTCGQITDNGIIKFASTLKSCVNVVKLNLDFSFCPKIP